jgi:hypothetical protein
VISDAIRLRLDSSLEERFGGTEVVLLGRLHIVVEMVERARRLVTGVKAVDVEALVLFYPLPRCTA